MSSHQQQVSQSNSLMNQLVNDSKLPNLASNLHEELFPLAQKIPQSLTYNLISESRVIKQIKNSRSLAGNVLRGFYYQLFKLCFEMYDPENTKNYLQTAKSIIFDRSIITQSKNQSYYKHLAQFINIMQTEQSQSFEQILSKYHEIDQALLFILQQLIQEGSSVSQQENQVEHILNSLCQLFQITLIPNHPYYQFEQSDIYFFIENEEKCYIVYNEEDEGEEDEEQGEQEQEQEEVQEPQIEKSNDVSQISVSQRSRNPSQLTQNNLKIDGNFTKQYTFQPEFKGQHQVFQHSNKTSEVSSSINSKQCNSRPVSNISYKSHLSSDSQYKRQERFEMKKEEVKNLDNYSVHQMPQRQPDPFKKGTFKISNPYELSSPSIFTKNLEGHAQYQNHYYSPSPTNDVPKPTSLGESHYVNNSISNYYEGYYAQIPQNTSVQSINSKNDTIMNIFGDMLKSGKYQGSYSEQNIGNKPTKKNIQQTDKILQAHEQLQKQDSSDLQPNFMKKINKFDPVEMMDRAKSVKSINQQNNSDFNTNSANNSKTLEYSIAQRPQVKENFHEYAESKNYSAIVEEKAHSYVEAASSVIQKNYKPNNFDDDQGIFYKPKKSQLKVISEVTASKQSIAMTKNNDDSKGSIYRQFSDTRILKLLRQPHKTKVQIMRNRFKGQHFNQ